jgi:hypothetical protein
MEPVSSLFGLGLRHHTGVSLKVAIKAEAIRYQIQLGVELGRPDRFPWDAKTLKRAAFAGRKMDNAVWQPLGTVLSAKLRREYRWQSAQ